MPEEININLNICDKIKSAADEYLRGELPAPEADQISGHIEQCADCAGYIKTEKIYLEEIKLAGYTPEISLSRSVMDKIIENVMIIDKPPKRRFVPVGFISAAAVVIIIAFVSNTGLFDFNTRIAQENDASPGSGYGDSGGAGELRGAFGNIIDDNADADESEFELGFAASPAAAADLAIAEAAPEAASRQFAADNYDDYTVLNSGLDITQIYEIYLAGGDRAEAMKNIEVYISGESLDIINKSHKAELDRYMLENSVAVGEIQSKNYDGEYIAVIWTE